MCWDRGSHASPFRCYYQRGSAQARGAWLGLGTRLCHTLTFPSFHRLPRWQRGLLVGVPEPPCPVTGDVLLPPLGPAWVPLGSLEPASSWLCCVHGPAHLTAQKPLRTVRPFLRIIPVPPDPPATPLACFSFCRPPDTLPVTKYSWTVRAWLCDLVVGCEA